MAELLRAGASGRRVTYLDVLQRVEDRGVSGEMVKAALRRLSREGDLVEANRAKIAGATASKDRKIIHYGPTDRFLAELGLSGSPTAAAVPAQPPAQAASAGEAAPAAPAQLSVPDLLEAVHARATDLGFVCELEDIVNFFLCLQAKPFLILSGISGTGKTQLPRIFAEAIGAVHALVPVKPNWADNADLMGYLSSVRGFVPGKLMTVLRSAINLPERPHFVVLDEMNLAHVEHYFSDVLSIMETRHRDKGRVITDPLPLDLPDSPPDGSDRWADLRSLHWPWNLFVIGTVNVDETTHPFSRKVLDRAFAFEFNRFDLTNFGSFGGDPVASEVLDGRALLDRPLRVTEIYDPNARFFDTIARDLQQINELLRPAELHFAYRVRDEIALYMWAWHRHGLWELLGRDDAFDLCLLQKVLPRIHGSSEAARRALEAILRYASAPRELGASPSNAATDGGQQVRPTGDTPIATHAEVSLANDDETRISAAATADASPGPRFRLPRTAEKADRMLRRYMDTGLVAFWS